MFSRRPRRKKSDIVEERRPELPKLINHRPKLFPVQPNIIYDIGQGIEDPLAKALFFFLYLTGCRINEATRFQVNHLRYDDNFATVKIYRLKQRAHDRSTLDELIIPIKGGLCNEAKMWSVVSRFLSDCQNFEYAFRPIKNMSEYLARRVRITADAEFYNPTTNNWATHDPINKRLNPHWLRHCRASHLAEYYDLSERQLMSYFGWKRADMASTYVKLTQMRATFERKIRESTIRPDRN